LFALVDLVDRLEQEKAAWRRFYRFFQYVELDGAMTARVAADLLGGGMGGKPWVLAMGIEPTGTSARRRSTSR
jgi:hypothetical protein